jgi:hypothetical protein
MGPRWFAVEAAAAAGLVAILPRARWSRALAGGLALLFVLVAVVDLGDVAARRSLARPLNLYLDLHLLASVRHLLEGTLGVAAATAALVGAAALAAGAAWALARLLAPPRGARRGVLSWMAGVGLLLFAGVGLAGEERSAVGTRTALPVVRVVRDQSRAVTRMLREQARFEAVMAERPASYAGRPGLLGRLGGRDVTLAFVESYGMSAVEDPRYAPVIRPRLEAMEALLDSAGLSVATGVLVAPSQGGQSWFGHGSVLSGLWLDNQMRYDLLLASDRETLVDDFERAGYRTVALMPAITLAWPEGRRLGYEEIWAHGDIDYAGPPLNWVTMPDQFTWSFLEETIRPRDPSRPLFAELGLISSHAPWTPILPVLDAWEAIGDGSVFQRWADAGETPRELWRDADRVREHYALSVEYALHTAASWAARHVGPDELAIILGDHQPAPLITGEGASRAVPVHVVSGDPALVEPFLAWGFRPGTLPPPADGARRMDAFRGWFVEAFSRPPGRLASEVPAASPGDAEPRATSGNDPAAAARVEAAGSGGNGTGSSTGADAHQTRGGGRP